MERKLFGKSIFVGGVHLSSFDLIMFWRRDSPRERERETGGREVVYFGYRPLSKVVWFETSQWGAVFRVCGVEMDAEAVYLCTAPGAHSTTRMEWNWELGNGW